MYVQQRIDFLDHKHAMFNKMTPVQTSSSEQPEPVYAEISEPIYDSVPNEEVELNNTKLIKIKPLITNYELVFTTNAQALKFLKSNK